MTILRKIVPLVRRSGTSLRPDASSVRTDGMPRRRIVSSVRLFVPPLRPDASPARPDVTILRKIVPSVRRSGASVRPGASSVRTDGTPRRRIGASVRRFAPSFRSGETARGKIVPSERRVVPSVRPDETVRRKIVPSFPRSEPSLRPGVSPDILIHVTTPPTRPALQPPQKADQASLAKFLKKYRPVLWVGAGASVAANYPGTNDLIREMVDESEVTIDPLLPFFEVADRFVGSQGEGALGDLLQRVLGPPRDPASLHLAIARLAKEGYFQAIVTTNYDDLLERTLAAAGVRCAIQPLEQNSTVVADGHIRLLKLHGSRENWADVILSSHSYQSFSHRYPFLVSQLDVLLRQHPVLFIGCSLQDPRILDWLTGLTPDSARALKPWRSLMIQKDWEKAAKAEALTRGNIRPYILDSHGQLGELLQAVAGEVKPDLARLEIEVELGDRWQARMAGVEWETADPLADENLLKDLEQLRDLGLRYLPTDERGHLSPEAAAAAGALR
ncbi:MAG TPA: SIR2 family protein, partial [Thermoanaerobaculia bacterium]|nr:SIR2 family protein [Thermoanaerobaculia bacterium]